MPKIGEVGWLKPSISGRYYCGLQMFGLTAFGGTNFAANTIYTIPWYRDEYFLADRIAINVRTFQALANAVLGVYRSAGGVPTSLLYTAGEIDCTATGIKEIIDLEWVLEPRTLYYIALANEILNVQYNVPSVTMIGSIIASPDADTGGYSGCTGVHVYDSALPDPFPALSYANTLPCIYLRRT